MSFKKKVFSGLKWVTLSNILRQVLSLVNIVILARLLVPEDFGVYAILLIFITFLTMFKDMGVAAFVVHTKEPSQLLLSSLFYFNLFIGILFASLLVLSSSWISHFYEMPSLELMIQIISLNLIITSVSIVSRALLQKQIDFKRLSIIETLSTILGIVLGISAAFYGLGVYSLLVQSIATSLLDTLLVVLYTSWRPSKAFSFNEIKRVWKYSSNLSGYRLMNYFATNSDNFLIGKYLSSGALGLYSIAYKIMLYPLQNITVTLMKVMFPAFSMIQDDNEKFKRSYLKVIFFITLVSTPLMVGLMAVSDIFVDLLFGEKWLGLSFLLVILAPSGILRSIFKTTGPLFTVKGTTDVQFKIGVVQTFLTIIGFIIGLSYGVNGVALSYLIVNIIIFYPLLKISWNQIGLSFAEGLSVIMPLLIISLIMGIAIFVLKVTILISLDSQLVKLLLLMVFGGSIYILMLKLKYKNLKKMFKV